jgi:DNA polymerase III epsilon subunit-like protein
MANGTNGYSRLAFLDTETTGAAPGKHELLEVGVVICDVAAPYGITDSFEAKVKPMRIEDAEPIALEINKYTEAGWADARSEKEVMEEFVYKVRGCSLWGWNVGFDRAFLEPAMNRAGHTLESAGLDFTWYDVKVLFMQWAKLTGRDAEFAPRYGLNSSARRAFSIENEDAHSALPDAMLTYRMFTRLQEEYLKLGEQLKQSTLF